MQPTPPPSSIHSRHFFSSLKLVEKRLKLDSTIHSSSPPPSPLPSPPPPPPPPAAAADSTYASTQSLGSPIYLNFDQLNTINTSTLQESEPPQQFLSNSSLDFPTTHQGPPQSHSLRHPQSSNSVESNGIDGIDMLIQLLGLSDSGNEVPGRVCLDLNCGGSGGNCGCDDGFYTKIVRAKGPKCGKELERLNGWIKHFANGGGDPNERRVNEPFRLTHLLLAKAAFLSQQSGEFECFDIPSTIDDFLRNDPPSEA